MMSEPARRLAQYLGKDYLFGIAQDYLFSHVYSDNREEAADKVLDLLTVSSRLGHEEATWLLSLWTIHNISARYQEGAYNQRSDFVKELFAGQTSARALAYLADFSDDEATEFKLAQKSAAMGDAYGEYILGTCYHHQDKHAEAIDCYWRAARRGIGAAYYMLAVQYRDKYLVDDENHYYRLHLKAAQLGEVASMDCAANGYHDYGDGCCILGQNIIEETRWRTRSKLFDDEGFNLDGDHFGYLQTKHGVETSFAAGRELDGCAELLPCLKDTLDDDTVYGYISMHRQISGAARRAAMIVMAYFKHLLSKDMRMMIARLVYASRLEPFAWYRPVGN